MRELSFAKFTLIAMLITVLVPSAFFTAGYVSIKNDQKKLSNELETSVSNKVEA